MRAEFGEGFLRFYDERLLETLLLAEGGGDSLVEPHARDPRADRSRRMVERSVKFSQGPLVLRDARRLIADQKRADQRRFFDVIRKRIGVFAGDGAVVAAFELRHEDEIGSLSRRL